MSQLEPTIISQVARLPQNSYSYPQSDTLLIGTTRARFSHDVNDEYVWTSRDSQLDIISSQLPEGESKSHMRQQCLIGSFNFAHIFNDSSIRIVASTQLVDKFGCKSGNEDGSEHAKYDHVLLVALTGSAHGSMLCICDIRQSAIIKSIDCPFKISSLETITTGTPQSHWPLAEELHVMNGIVACGSEGGLVFLIDLALDECTSTCDYDRTPRKVSFAVFNSRHINISHKRESSLVHNQTMCLPLNSDAQHKTKFYFRRNTGEVMASFSTSKVYVSSLNFVPQFKMLCVGYNFGSFQLFSLQNFDLKCACAIDESLPPILAFTFQEPENDPRNYCYLWVIRGNEMEEENSYGDELNDRQSLQIDDCTYAVMYSLCFDAKVWINDYGTLYKGFNSIEARFEYSFSTKPYVADNMYQYKSRLINCYTIQQGDLSCYKSQDDDSTNLDLGLCVFVWEACESKETSSTYLAIFDINQWYQAQMPGRIGRARDDNHFCPYLGIFSLNDVANTISTTDAILDVQLDAQTIVKFRSESCPHDLHYFPSSLSFQVKVLSESQLCSATYLGFPSRVLSRMVSSGPSILLDPKEYMEQCIMAGLITLDQAAGALEVSSQRELLLTLALEHDALPFLIETIQQWSSGELNHVGCNCKFILDWIWNRVSFIKSSIDEITYTLFDYSGQLLDHVNMSYLGSYESDLKCLTVLLKKLQDHGTPTTEQGMSELSVRKEITQMITMYLRVLLWLLDCNLLPEHAENEAFGEMEVAYPASLFAKYFEDRREELGANETSSLLLIDGIVNVNSCNSKLSELWKNGSGSGQYPPPNLHSLIGIYLLESISIEQKHAIMYYSLLELINYLHDRQTDIAERIKTFPSVFNLSTGFTKFVQGIWALDHKEFNYGINTLFDPSVKTILSNDQSFKSFHTLHHRIVEVLLSQHEHQKALLYSQSSGHFATDSPQKERLHLALLLLNGQISEAFEYQRVCRTENNMEELLKYLFSVCEQMKMIDKIFKLPLDELEEEVLVEYLFETSNEPNAKQILVLYFILNNKIIDAANLLNQCKAQFAEITSQDLFEKTEKLATLISAYVAALPRSLTKLAKEIYLIEEQRQKSGVPKIVSGDMKTPLRVSAIEKVSISWLAPSQVIESVMEQIEAVWAKEQLTAATNSSTPMRTSRSNQSHKTSLLCQKSPFLRTPITDLRSTKSKHLVEATYRSPSDGITLTEKKLEGIKKNKNKPLDWKVKAKAHADKVNATQPIKNFDHSNLIEFSQLHSILETPKISRKSSARKQQASVSEISGMSSTNYSTPVSILKVKRMMRRSMSPLSLSPSHQKQHSQRTASRAGSQASTSSQPKLRFFGIPSPEPESPEGSPGTDMDVTNSFMGDNSDIGTFGSIQDTFKLNPPAAILDMDEDDEEVDDLDKTPLVIQEDSTFSNMPNILTEQIVDASALMSEEEMTIDESQYETILPPPATRSRSRSKDKEKPKSKDNVEDNLVTSIPSTSSSLKVEAKAKVTEKKLSPSRRDSRSRSRSLTPGSNLDVDESASDISQLSKTSSTRSKSSTKKTPKVKSSASSVVVSDASIVLPDTPSHVMTTRSKSKTPTKSLGKKGKGKSKKTEIINE